MPSEFEKLCIERESDEYYILDLLDFTIKKELMRQLNRASLNLKIKKTRIISDAHRRLIKDFIETKKPNQRVTELFLRTENFVKEAETALVLDCVDSSEKLVAFYVLEVGEEDFITYLIGTYDRKNYVPHASDLLFFEMINIAKEKNKRYINLGLGVNEGLRRFKKKWGGKPFLKYELCGFNISSPYNKFLISYERAYSF